MNFDLACSTGLWKKNNTKIKVQSVDIRMRKFFDLCCVDDFTPYFSRKKLYTVQNLKWIGTNTEVIWDQKYQVLFVEHIQYLHVLYIIRGVICSQRRTFRWFLTCDIGWHQVTCPKPVLRRPKNCLKKMFEKIISRTLVAVIDDNEDDKNRSKMGWQTWIKRYVPLDGFINLEHLGSTAVCAVDFHTL